MRTQLVRAFITALMLGSSVDGAAQTVKVLYSAPLGSNDTFSSTQFVASVVNLDTALVSVTVSFCDLAGQCDTDVNDHCVSEQLLAQQGCVARFDPGGSGFRYAKIEVVSGAKKVLALGQLSADILVGSTVIKTTVPAH